MVVSSFGINLTVSHDLAWESTYSTQIWSAGPMVLNFLCSQRLTTAWCTLELCICLMNE